MNAYARARTLIARIDLEELAGLRQVMSVLVFGNVKHPTAPWRNQTAHEHIAHAFAHARSWLAGTKRDPESGESNLAHAATRMLFAIAKEYGG